MRAAPPRRAIETASAARSAVPTIDTNGSGARNAVIWSTAGCAIIVPWTGPVACKSVLHGLAVREGRVESRACSQSSRSQTEPRIRAHGAPFRGDQNRLRALPRLREAVGNVGLAVSKLTLTKERNARELPRARSRARQSSGNRQITRMYSARSIALMLRRIRRPPTHRWIGVAWSEASRSASWQRCAAIPRLTAPSYVPQREETGIREGAAGSTFCWSVLPGGHALQLSLPARGVAGTIVCLGDGRREDTSSLLAGESTYYAFGPTTRNIPNLIRNLRLAGVFFARFGRR